MERKGMNVNVTKTRVMVVTAKKAEVVSSGRYPCAVCGNSVNHNSNKCTVFDVWCHNRCSAVRNISNALGVQCLTCKKKKTESGMS